MKDGEQGRFYPAPDLGRPLIFKKASELCQIRVKRGCWTQIIQLREERGKTPVPFVSFKSKFAIKKKMAGSGTGTSESQQSFPHHSHFARVCGSMRDESCPGCRDT